MNEAAKNARALGRGDFFAVDRRAWAFVCQTGSMNAALAYLFLACGTQGDMRTTSWSAESIKNRTGLDWRKANAAIDKLKSLGLVRQDRAGRRPRYYVMAAHSIRGCEGFVAPPLTSDEKALLDRMRKSTTRDKTVAISSRQEYEIACRLAYKGHAIERAKSSSHWLFSALPAPAEFETPPEWIWLPNALVNGVSSETPPIELVRQSGRPAALRLLVDLYGAQSLEENGGVHWRQLRMSYEREKLGERGIYVVWGFVRKTLEMWQRVPFVRAHMTGEMVDAGDGRKWDAGLKIFWDALATLTDTGLVEFVEHVIEHDHATGDHAAVIHPYARSAGEPMERALGEAAQSAGWAMLANWKQDELKRLGKDDMLMLPAKRHLADVQMVGLARLKYRARSSATAAWLSRTSEWERLAKAFDEMTVGLEKAA